MGTLRELVLELTDHCPLNCMHCSSDSCSARAHHLTAELSFSLVAQAAAIGAEQVSFGGGEPACSPLLAPVAERVVASGMRAEVFTCGALRRGNELGPWPQGFVDGLARLSNLKIIFSAHGDCSEVHDAITRVPGSFASMLQTLDMCVVAGLRAELNFVPLRRNVDSFAGLIGLAEEHRVPKVSVLRFVPQGRGEAHRAQLQLSNEDEDAFVEELLGLRARTAVEIRTGSPFNGLVPGNNVPCRAGREKLVVQADGNVLPCEVFKASTMRGWGLSVYREGLADILEAPVLRRLRADVTACDAHACPVHTRLRAEGSREASHVRRDIPEPAIHV